MIDNLIDESQTYDPLFKKRIYSASGILGRDWLRVFPTKKAFMIDSSLFITSIQLRLGIDPSFIPGICKCKTDLSDPTTSLSHLAACHTGGFIIQRHNTFRDLITKFARSLGIYCYHEPTGTFFNTDNGEPCDRRPDVILINLFVSEKTAIDVAVSSFYTKTNRTVSTIDYPTNHTEAYKIKPADGLSPSFTFAPFAINDLGDVGPHALRILNRFQEIAPPSKYHDFRCEASVALAVTGSSVFIRPSL